MAKRYLAGSLQSGCTANLTGGQYILLNDFTCCETRLHNADWFDCMITLGSIQRYAV